MQKRFRLSALLILLGLTLLTFPGVAAGKSYTISRAVLEATLLPDGSLAVTETRTYQFDGAFSHIYQLIRLPQRSVLEHLGLADEQGPMEPTGTQEAGTFTAVQEGTDWRVDGYFRAENAARTFTLTYRIADAVRMHEDGAELYWNLIGEEWEVGTAQADVTVHLPGDPVDAWVEGLRDAEVYTGSQIQFVRRDLPAGEAMTLRVMLPREAVPQSTLPPDGETVRAIRAKAGRVTSPVSIGAQALWLLAAMAGSLWFYRNYVKRGALAPAPAEALHPLPPAVVSHFTGQKEIDGLRATLVDLVTRGAVAVQQDGDVWTLTRTDVPGLVPLEEGALDLLFPNGRRTVTTADWQESGSQSRYNQLQKWWVRVGEQVPKEWDLPHRLHMYGLALLGVVVALLTYPSPLRTLTWIASALLVVVGFAQRSLTDEGYRQREGWRTVRREWEKGFDLPYLPVAVALGLNVADAFDHADGWEVLWIADTFTAMDGYWAQPSSSDGSSDSGGGGGGDGGGGGGAE